MSKTEEHMPTIRVLRMLEIISQSASGCTLTELSNKSQIPRSSLVPILHTLRKESMLNFNLATSKYTLGIKAFEIGNKVFDQFNIMDSIKQEMESMVNVCRETSHFAILVNQDVVFIWKEDSPESIRMHSTVGNRIPAYGTGLGKALLSDFTADDLRALYPEGLKPITENTITDFDKLAEQLKEIKKTQLAYEFEESSYHLQCIAVPICKNNIIQAALSVTIPTFRANDENLKLIEMLLLNSKKNIELMLTKSNASFHKFDNF